MRDPLPEEYVVCPRSTKGGPRLEPEKVWQTDSGQAVGRLKRHHHTCEAIDCEWTGMPVPVRKLPGKERED